MSDKIGVTKREAKAEIERFAKTKGTDSDRDAH